MENLEIKAKFELWDNRHGLADSIHARYVWTRIQVDTYFNVEKGKLKLRQVEGFGAELIAYHRPELKSARLSDYLIYRSIHGETLKDVLASVLQKDVVIQKKRELYLWNNIRIHFDQVDALGRFVEFEAVIDHLNPVKISEERLDTLCSHFEITSHQLISCGYYELIKGSA